MAVAQGYGKTVTSGSVFAYDVADTRNSYIGEPTTNHIYHQNPRIDTSYESYMPYSGNGSITANHPGAIRVYNTNGSDISNYVNTGVGDWTNQQHAYWVYDQVLKKPVVRMYNVNESWQSKYYDPGIGSLTNIGVSAGSTYVISWLQYVENLDRCAHAGLYSYSNTNGYHNFWDGTSGGSSTSKNTFPLIKHFPFATVKSSTSEFTMTCLKILDSFKSPSFAKDDQVIKMKMQLKMDFIILFGFFSDLII
jgi:hypothetical protein